MVLVCGIIKSIALLGEGGRDMAGVPNPGRFGDSFHGAGCRQWH